MGFHFNLSNLKAETGDKALTSWWAVKLGRFQLWKKHANLCTVDTAVTLVSMLLWLKLSWVVIGLSPHLDINQDYFTDLKKKKKKFKTRLYYIKREPLQLNLLIVYHKICLNIASNCNGSPLEWAVNDESLFCWVSLVVLEMHMWAQPVGQG